MNLCDWDTPYDGLRSLLDELRVARDLKREDLVEELLRQIFLTVGIRP